MFIGMRIIKPALAVAVSAYLAMWLGLDSPFFAAIAAIITMQGNLIDTVGMARDRVLGTAFGGVIGVAGAYLAHGSPLVLGLGIGLIIFVANRLHWHRAISIATIVFASIMLGDSGDSALVASFNRIIDTMVGIIVAVTVNYTISRPLSRDRVLKSARDLGHKFKSILGMLICQEEGVSLGEIAEKIRVIESELPAVRAELRMHIARKRPDIDFEDIKAKVLALYRHISLLASMGSCRLSEANAKMVNRMYGVDLKPEGIQEETDVVFNYHLQVSLKTLNELFALLKADS